ncbi:MAG: glycerophosphodiester phosphodiesterase family protein [Bacilli bacterium]|nr:glycerophosphodiester phosphodiesterase family protein [Bacilli bacterium]MDY0208610.1 glycerophosphodiester phosphodiesterase family protein [Bacilli bacterium]
MDTLKIAKENVKMIAHRGLSGLEKENTIAAFIAAGNRTYYGTECDIHLTKDNVFVVCHDDHTGRVSPVKKIIKELTYEELSQICLYGFETQTTRSYLKIPTLREYLEISKKYNKYCIIEIKCALEKKDVDKLLAEVEEFGYLNNVIFISFNLENLKKIRRVNKNLQLQYLISTYTKELPGLCKKEKIDIDISYHELNLLIMEEFHSLDVKVNAWTVNNPIEALILVSWNIDYITTNILE